MLHIFQKRFITILDENDNEEYVTSKIIQTLSKNLDNDMFE